MTDPRAQRTLVKSPPELWAEVSDADALARHLGEFGDIRITGTDPETTVAWEGDRVRGTVELEASGWGTKVTLTAEAPAPALPAPVVEEVAPPAAAPARAPAPLPAASRRPGLLALFRRRPRAGTPEPIPLPQRPAPAPAPDAEPQPLPPAATAPAPAPVPAPHEVEAVLVGVLDDLGSAQKRPFRR